MSTLSILVIDDERDFCDFLTSSLEDLYDVEGGTNGEDALALFEQRMHDIVLLDINLPDIDGYEICKKIKKKSKKDALVLFISGHDTLEERLRAYEHGGDDFISKPVQIKELVAKIKTLEQYKKSKKKLKKSSENASELAFQSMEEANQMGVVFRFLRESFQCTNYLSLGQSMLAMMQALELKCCVQIRATEQTLTMCQECQVCPPIEEEIFKLCCNRGRLFAFNNRIMVNDEHVSILVKNMPIDNEVLNGRFKDILAPVIETCESSYQNIRRQNALLEIMEDIQMTVSLVEQELEIHGKNAVAIMDEMVEQISNSLNVLGLTEEQELFCASLVEKSIEKLADMQATAVSIDQHLGSVMQKINSAVSR